MECVMFEATSTEYEKSTTSSENEEKSQDILADGMKRKIEEEDSEADEYEFGESDDEPDDLDEEEDDEGEDEDPDEDILIDGRRYSNQDVLDFMLDPADLKITNKRLNKARRYLKSVEESNGFHIADWPGYIQGLATIVPRTKLVVGKRHRYPEGYKYMMILADKAIQGYNIDYDTKYKVERIEQVNSRPTKGYTYYITFIACHVDSNHEVTFQTMIWNNFIDRVIVIRSCSIKQA